VGRHAGENYGTKSIKLIHAAHANAAQAIEQHIAPGYEVVCGTKHNIAWENSKVITTNNRYVPGHFLRIHPCGGGGGGEASTKRNHTILSVERCQMVIGNKKFGVVSYLIVEGIGIFSLRKFLYFSTPRTAIRAFSETDFWIYRITLCCR
jgi:hypothetical protein